MHSLVITQKQKFSQKTQPTILSVSSNSKSYARAFTQILLVTMKLSCIYI